MNTDSELDRARVLTGRLAVCQNLTIRLTRHTIISLGDWPGPGVTPGRRQRGQSP